MRFFASLRMTHGIYGLLQRSLKMHEEKIDEILEHIWTHEEEFQNRVNRDMVAQWIDAGSVEMVLADMERKGLVRIYDSLVVLSASGRKAAEQIIRRHRLAERLTAVRKADVLDYLRADGKTIVISSHMLPEIERLSDRLAIIDKGRLLKVGAKKEFLHGLRLEDEFLRIVKEAHE